VTEWESGKPETVCGKGSMYRQTKAHRKFIPHVIDKYDIWGIADIGCGDQNWIHRCLPDGIEYRGFDIRPRRQDVVPFDVTREVLPEAYDLVLCIAVLNHLKPDQAERALRLIQMSDAKFVVMTYTAIDEYATPGELMESVFLRQRTVKGKTYNSRLGVWKL